MDRHNDMPIHKCKVCPKTFKHKQDLNQHMKLHTGVGLHKCKVSVSKIHANLDSLLGDTDSNLCALVEMAEGLSLNWRRKSTSASQTS